MSSSSCEVSIAAGAKGAISSAGHVQPQGRKTSRRAAGGFFARWLPPCGEHRLLQSHGGEIQCPATKFLRYSNIFRGAYLPVPRPFSLSFPSSACLSFCLACFLSFYRAFILRRFLGRLPPLLFFYPTSRTRPSTLSLSTFLSFSLYLTGERDERLLHTLDFKRKGTR